MRNRDATASGLSMAKAMAPIVPMDIATTWHGGRSRAFWIPIEMISGSEIFSDTDHERREILSRPLRTVSFWNVIVLRRAVRPLIQSDTIEPPHFRVSELNCFQQS